MIETIACVAPIIRQLFDRALLSHPAPKLRDSLLTFDRMWAQALKLWYKLDANPQRKARCDKLKEEILELYERAKIKEEECESQKGHKTQEFGYHVSVPQGLAQDVHGRLAFGRKDGSFKYVFRKNYAIPKIGKVGGLNE